MTYEAEDPEDSTQAPKQLFAHGGLAGFNIRPGLGSLAAEPAGLKPPQGTITTTLLEP